MPHLREEADADRIENYLSMTDHRTDLNQYELLCGSCGRSVFVDKDTSAHFRRAMEHDLDNLFLCDHCQTEMDELAYAAH
jgi:hypothetical protein